MYQSVFIVQFGLVSKKQCIFVVKTKNIAFSNIADMDKRSNWQEFEKVLEEHNIKSLYHFTDRDNLESIIKNGGLFSWADCEERGINIAKPGGNVISHALDVRCGLEYYVHLSFTDCYQIMPVATEEDRINNLVTLEIDPSAILKEKTKFSDMKATHLKANVGETLEDLKRILFNSTVVEHPSDLVEPERPFSQTEVHVLYFIPLKYIKNIESFGTPVPEQAESVQTDLFGNIIEAVQHPQDLLFDEESLLKDATKDEHERIFRDRYGAIYSSDRKRLIQGPTNTTLSHYSIRYGTLIISSKAFDKSSEIYDEVGGEEIEQSILASVSIPDTVTHICDEAFYNCHCLRRITISDSVTYIGDRAFYGTGLNSITLPKSLKHLGTNPFLFCYLKNVVSESPYFVVSDNAIYSQDKTQLICYFGIEESVTLPEGVTHIGDSAFCFSSVRFVSWSEDETQFNYLIDNDVFPGDDVKSIILPKSVTHIGDEAFNNCYGLKIISLPPRITHVGDRAFKGCRSIQSISFPDGFTHIGDETFSECFSLESVFLPDSVTYIGDRAFYGTRLNSITLPKSLKHLCANPFSYCDLKNVVSESPYFVVSDNGIYSQDKTQLICYFGKEESVTLPEGVTHIGDRAFYDCKSLKIVSLPVGLIDIGNYAFCGCRSLRFVSFPNSLTHIGRGAFECCSLQSVSLSSNLKYLGECAFYACSVQYVSLSEGLTKIGDETFYQCRSLKFISLPNSVTHIGCWAFFECNSLQTISIPSGITHIGKRAFSKSGLQTITLPKGVKYIGDEAFYWCESLSDISLPNSLADIGREIFSSCYSLRKIIVPKGAIENIRKLLGNRYYYVEE